MSSKRLQPHPVFVGLQNQYALLPDHSLALETDGHPFSWNCSLIGETFSTNRCCAQEETWPPTHLPEIM